jgi:hypothetical protein
MLWTCWKEKTVPMTTGNNACTRERGRVERKKHTRCPLASSPVHTALFSRRPLLQRALHRFPLLSRVCCPLLPCARPSIARRRPWSGSRCPCLPTGREGGQDPARRREEKEDPARGLFCSSFLGMLLSSATLVFRCSLVRSSVDFGGD